MWMSWRNIWDVSATLSEIKREWYVCMQVCTHDVDSWFLSNRRYSRIVFLLTVVMVSKNRFYTHHEPRKNMVFWRVVKTNPFELAVTKRGTWNSCLVIDFLTVLILPLTNASCLLCSHDLRWHTIKLTMKNEPHWVPDKSEI
jgi:hypothetical protein